MLILKENKVLATKNLSLKLYDHSYVIEYLSTLSQGGFFVVVLEARVRNYITRTSDLMESG